MAYKIAEIGLPDGVRLKIHHGSKPIHTDPNSYSNGIASMFLNS